MSDLWHAALDTQTGRSNIYAAPPATAVASRDPSGKIGLKIAWRFPEPWPVAENRFAAHKFEDIRFASAMTKNPHDSRPLEENLPGSVDSSQIPNLFANHGNRVAVNHSSAPMQQPVAAKKTMLPMAPQEVLNQPSKLSSPQNLNDLNPNANGSTGRKYQCKMCPQIFMHKSAMQHHAREAHRGDIKPYQCQQCLKSFSSNHQLLQHIRIHTGEKPYKCSYCDRRFKQLSHVQQHTRLHTGERPYKCHLPECNRAFIQLSNLQQHLRNHDSQVERAKNRPYICNTCGKCFATDSSLRTHGSKQHVAMITAPFSHVCPMCHKTFVNSESLVEHMHIIHKDGNAPGMTNLKLTSSEFELLLLEDCFLIPSKRRSTNHQCPLCGKSYVNEGSLRKHISSHQEPSTVPCPPLRMWPCTVCQNVFTQETGKYSKNCLSSSDGGDLDSVNMHIQLCSFNYEWH